MTKLIAFYLPQFYPIPENDSWWGKGFTEWRNVVAARPIFDGHYQPHLPADLGFYDLRVPETRQLQANLARIYGISAFCYYHYWFMGKRLLERPFEEVLSSGKPDFPFLLCWANHRWTRYWDGGSDAILMDQKYSPDDDAAHIRSLLPAFRDPRYFRVDGRPMFLVYRPTELPDPKRTTEIWRKIAFKEGIGELHLVAVSHDNENPVYENLGFDAGLLWIPNLTGHYGIPLINGRRIWDYSKVVLVRNKASYFNGKIYETVIVTFDNTPRRHVDPVVFHGSTPELYGKELRRAIQDTKRLPERDKVVFIYAWNEWAEGSHLEPDMKWGLKYLEETRASLASPRTSLKKQDYSSTIHETHKTSISVVIPTIGRPTLERTLLSIEGQLSGSDEVIVVADGERPAARAICSRRWPFLIRYFEHGPTNAWGHAQRNFGMGKASGAYLAFMDDDDIYLPGAIDIMRATAEWNPGVPIIFRENSPIGIYWREKTWRDVWARMPLVPNVKSKLPKWRIDTMKPDGSCGDLLFAMDVMSAWSHESVVWSEAVTTQSFGRGLGRL